MPRKGCEAAPESEHPPESLGLLRSPFAAQGRSYTIKSDLPETIESPTGSQSGCLSRSGAVYLWELAIACDEAGTGLYKALLPSSERAAEISGARA